MSCRLTLKLQTTLLVRVVQDWLTWLNNWNEYTILYDDISFSLFLSLYIQLQLLMYVLLILAIIRWWCEGMWGPNAITRPKSEHSVLDIGTTLWQFLLELVHGAWWPWHFQTVQRWQTLQHSNYWALVRAVNDGWHGRSAAMLPIS